MHVPIPVYLGVLGNVDGSRHKRSTHFIKLYGAGERVLPPSGAGAPTSSGRGWLVGLRSGLVLLHAPQQASEAAQQRQAGNRGTPVTTLCQPLRTCMYGLTFDGVILYDGAMVRILDRRRMISTERPIHINQAAGPLLVVHKW